MIALFKFYKVSVLLLVKGMIKEGLYMVRKTKVTVHPDYKIGVVEKRLFGAFLEPIGNWVYGGIYNPKHPSADEMGFRQDVLEAVKEFGLPAIRLPGGNWVSGWEWENSIGPIENRKVQLDLAWFQIEPNIIGLDEYLEWTKKANTEPMFTINLGTEDLKSAAHLVEYCKHEGGTYWSELRKKYGHSEAYPIKIWYLGNEMDGHWQIGSWEKDPSGFGIFTHEVSKAIKWIDNKAETVLSGVSDYSKHFPEWLMKALEQCYESVDYISVHYYHTAPEGDVANYLNVSSVLEEYIRTITAICDYLQAKIGAPKRMYISFDEYGAHFGKQGEITYGRRGWKDASKVFSQYKRRENIFTMYEPDNFIRARRTSHQMLEALGVASILLTFIRHADRIKIGCMTGGLGSAIAFDGEHVWKNAAYYPYYQMNKLASGGVSILPVVNGPTFNTEQYALNDFNQSHSYENVQVIEAAAVYHEEKEEVDIFIINRAIEDDIEVTLDVRGFENYKLIDHMEMYTDDIIKGNSFEHPEVIIPMINTMTKIEDGKVIAMTKKLSWNVIRLSKSGS
jgi:alpha-N-arabinofuranosidase